jgi:hypothetical protein
MGKMKALTRHRIAFNIKAFKHGVTQGYMHGRAWTYTYGPAAAGRLFNMGHGTNDRYLQIPF